MKKLLKFKSLLISSTDIFLLHLSYANEFFLIKILAQMGFFALKNVSEFFIFIFSFQCSQNLNKKILKIIK